LWARWATGATHSRDALEAAVEPYPAQVYENGSGLQIEIKQVESRKGAWWRKTIRPGLKQAGGEYVNGRGWTVDGGE